jgi:hypothetical protein
MFHAARPKFHCNQALPIKPQESHHDVRVFYVLGCFC